MGRRTPSGRAPRRAPLTATAKSALAALLLAASASAQGFGGACTAGGSPCEHVCPSGTFDLSGFKARTPAAGFFNVQDADGHNYYFDACGPISAVTCQGSTVTVGPVCVQTWGDPPPQPPSFPAETCGALGKFSTQQCSLKNVGNFTCQYTDGDGQRTAEITYTCGETYETPTASQPDPDASPPHYVITFVGPDACAAGAGPKGASWGTMFMIFFPLGMMSYLGGGYFYNHKYKDLRGVEAVPQLEYWKQVPGLVKDGCIFSKEQTMIFIAYVQEKQRGTAGADAGLKRALAADEGEAETTYEERAGA